MTKLLTNGIGSYLLSGISSRYSGLFFLIKGRMFKILDENSSDNISLASGKNIAVIESKKWSYLLFDVKESYDNSEFGRYYTYDKKNNMIKFTKKTGNKVDYKIYIKLSGKFEIKNIEKWAKKNYDFDKNRNSPPFERYVYCPFAFKGKILIASDSKKPKETNFRIAKKQEGISQLLVENKGIYAGLPWFFQFWSRDELISLKGLSLAGKKKQAKDIFMKNLNAIAPDGRLPNQLFPHSKETNADSIGWLFKRFSDFNFSKKEKTKIIKKLESSIKNIEKNYMKDYLIYNAPKETWMDTEWNNDNRAGFRVEIQALFLNMLKLAYKLTGKKEHLQKEKSMRSLVKKRFWNKKILADGLDDFTIRPNVFIAYYTYPELLSKKEWKTCFKNILPSLWLEWGGLSTIDINHPLFCKDHTGEIPKSYHRGDSWFWLNNLAAICMKKVNNKVFKKYISKISEASNKEFKSGIKYQCAELSSASRLESNGCLAQAWSDAMLEELNKEI